ncbi:hypothetical protein ILUMI_00881 [Ignelater luminosus]|uniref:Uncharacterized protein n=1 Tax=Ignelater luminosus TaxID=2038154 RepID=A0A8K0DL29_IGNLU|nr:hypothetical protein ILUMI_00881 [Ignelater luminosus]
MFGRLVSANCRICFFKPLFTFSAIVGQPGLITNCWHRGNIKEYEVIPSKFNIVTSVLTVLFLLTGSVCSIYEIIIHDKSDVFVLLTLTTHLLFYVRAIMCVTFSALHTNLSKTNVLGGEKIADIYATIKTGDSLKESETKRFALSTYISCSSAVVTLIGYGVYVIFKKYMRVLELTENLAMIFGFYVDFMIIVSMHCTALIYKLTFKNYFSNLKKVLLNHLQDDAVDWNKIKLLQKNHKTKLSRYLNFVRRTYSATVWNLRSFNSYSDPQTAIWIIIAIVTSIFNIYITMAVKLYGVPESFIPGFIELQLQFFISSVVLYYAAVPFDDLRSVVSGTVITYVLVALQFHAAWMN